MNKSLSNLGLAFRAGKILIGSDYVIKGIKNKKVFLIVLDKDNHSLLEKEIINLSIIHNVPLIRDYSSVEISNSIGQNNVHVVGITDEGFKKLIMNN